MEGELAAKTAEAAQLSSTLEQARSDLAGSAKESEDRAENIRQLESGLADKTAEAQRYAQLGDERLHKITAKEVNGCYSRGNV